MLIWRLEHDMPHPPEYMAERFRLLITLDLRQVLGLKSKPGFSVLTVDAAEMAKPDFFPNNMTFVNCHMTQVVIH